jgi:hypothetical protein
MPAVLKDISRLRVVVVWCVLVLVMAALSVVAGADITLSNGGLLLVAFLAPPVVMLLVWRDAPPDTIAEVLHSVNRSSKETRP